MRMEKLIVPMKVLITGATGRVGSRLAPRLQQRGHTVRVLVRQPEQGEPFQRLGLEVAVGDAARWASSYGR
jgi:uncharacterized protein YbjT (DUF2867 family)